ncbi:MAG: hypothetical protein JXA66_09350 [Oligoflexia bacterium]|nr:hypothetical protein [Oligoflexia bacterium]
MRRFIVLIFVITSAPVFCEISLSFHGNYERAQQTSTSWNAFGGGLSLGLGIAEEAFIEVYFDALKHQSPFMELDSLIGSSDAYTAHYGGKLVLLPFRFVIIRGGCGIAAAILTINNEKYIENKFEAVASAGFHLPVADKTGLTIEVQYRRIFTETDDLNYLGLQAGIFFRI